MTQLEKVQYTVNAHTTDGRDCASRSDDGRLDVKLSTLGTPGTGPNLDVNHSPTAKLFLPLKRMIMSAVSLAPARRRFLATSAAACAFGLVLLAAPIYAQTVPAADAEVSVISLLPTKLRDAVRPFRVNVPEEALVDLRRRVAATRWPDRETVTDQSQGVPLAKIQALVRYWGTGWRIRPPAWLPFTISHLETALLHN
jgi:Epoxide hydrolase N terminus